MSRTSAKYDQVPEIMHMMSHQAQLGFGAGVGAGAGFGAGVGLGASGTDDGAANLSKVTPAKPEHRLSTRLVSLLSHLRSQSLWAKIRSSPAMRQAGLK